MGVEEQDPQVASPLAGGGLQNRQRLRFRGAGVGAFQQVGPLVAAPPPHPFCSSTWSHGSAGQRHCSCLGVPTFLAVSITGQ